MTTTQHVPARTGTERIKELDWLMLAVVGLSCVGLVMAVSIQSVQSGGDTLLAMKRQGTKLVAGVVMFVFCAALPLHRLRRGALPLFGVLTLLVYLAALVGAERNHASRWLQVGSISFQPVDFARLAMILLTADLIARSGERIVELRAGLAKVLLPSLVLAGGLFMQPDNGNALLCVALAVAMAFAAGVRLRWLALMAGGVLPVLAVLVGRHGYAMDRISRWLSEEPHYQVQQSLMAIQMGGFAGEGVGAGWRKMGFLPEPQNDFVFAIIGEELGFLGSALVVGLFTLIGVVGCRLALQLRDPFHRYVVFGCTVAICAQALINLLVATGMAPAKGIDLPFISAGGTNLVACLGAVGLIGNAARSDRFTS